MNTFHLPDLGEGLQEAEIIEWHVGVGDAVVADQPLVSVETDKAVVEVPSPSSGRVARIYVEAGTVVTIGAPLIDFEEVGEADAGTVVGEIPRNSRTIGKPFVPPASKSRGIKATPSVRELARKLGVDLAKLDPSGRDGAVTSRDVERAAGMSAQAGPAETLRGVRRAMARKMARSHAEVVPATLHDEADVEEWEEGADVTGRMVRAIVAACRAEPALNAWYDGVCESRKVHETVDLGIALDAGDGLLVPILKDAGKWDQNGLRRQLERLKERAMARKLAPEELTGASISLSNFGVLGAGRHATMVVLPPQVAIVGAGRIVPRVVARDGQSHVRRMLPLSLTIDHRAVTGGEAARFLAAMRADLEMSDSGKPAPGSEGFLE